MGQIDRVGTFRGYILDKSLDSTKNGFPQAILRLQAAEMYDPETKQWLDWSKYDETEITAYLVLNDKAGERNRNFEQLMKALGWSGTSSAEFEEADYSKIAIQFKVKLDTYNGKTRLQVSWIDHADADPSGSLRHLDAQGLKALEAKWPKLFKPTTGAPKAVPTSKPSAPPVVAAAPAVVAPAPTPLPTDVAVKQAEAAAPAVDPDPTPDSEAVPNTGIAAHLNLPATCANAQEAYDHVIANYSKTEFTEAQVQEAWLRTVEDLGGEAGVEQDHAWANVRDIVLETMTDNPTL
jgi:hypothetical protein